MNQKSYLFLFFVCCFVIIFCLICLRSSKFLSRWEIRWQATILFFILSGRLPSLFLIFGRRHFSLYSSRWKTLLHIFFSVRDYILYFLCSVKTYLLFLPLSVGETPLSFSLPKKIHLHCFFFVRKRFTFNSFRAKDILFCFSPPWKAHIALLNPQWK